MFLMMQVHKIGMKPSTKFLVAAILFAATSLLQGCTAFLYNALIPRDLLLIRLNMIAAGLFALAAFGLFIRSVKERRTTSQMDLQ
jgi:hypothetical protein